jgi:hypothetical protein
VKATTVVTRGSAATVALVAGYVSYLHIVAVALRFGERPEVAYALPICVDALMVMSTLALLADRSNRWAQAGFLFGVGVSVVCNVASAQPSWPARGIAAIPAVTLLLAVEVLARSGRQVSHDVNERTAGQPVPAGASTGAPARAPRRAGRRPAAVKVAAARVRLGPDATQGQVAKAAKVSIRSAARYWTNTTNGNATDAALHQSPPEKSGSGSAEPSPNSREHSGAPVTVDA